MTSVKAIAEWLSTGYAMNKIDESQLEDALIVLMKGLPYSGKSTAILDLMKNDTDGVWHSACVVSPDAIRVAMHGQRFLPRAEPLVWATARIMARALVLAGHRVIFIDATSITYADRREWSLYGDNWNVQVWEIKTPMDICTVRAKSAGDMDIIPIIDKMDLKMQGLREHEKSFNP